MLKYPTSGEAFGGFYHPDLWGKAGKHMAGKSKKIMHPAMKQIIIALNCSNLAELSRTIEVPVTTLASYAYEGKLPSFSVSAFKLANAVNMTIEELRTLFMSPDSLAS